jgi:pyruvate dehydrogenase E1 component alpha subunit
MAVIRATEKAAYDLFMAGLVKGTTHLASGQEAVAVGASAALEPDDYVFATYRGHHHAIARGASPEGCLAELMSRATGLCGAKGGSMHLTVADHNMLGSYAIVGAHLPIACGAAWSAKLRGTSQVAVAFFGDGATNIGAFHEALNLAAVWKLPVLFVCENNLYMEYTSIKTVTAVPSRPPGGPRLPAPGRGDRRQRRRRRAAGRGRAAARARAGDGPTVIEALTYRQYGTRAATPASTGPRRRSTPGSSATRCWSWPSGCATAGSTSRPSTSSTQRPATRCAAASRRPRRPRPPRGDGLHRRWADGGAQWRT